MRDPSARVSLEAVGQAFLAQHPIGSVISTEQMLDWVAAHGDEHLKTALLIGRVDYQLSAIRRHLNSGSADRYRVDYNDAEHKTFVVRGTKRDKPLLTFIETSKANNAPIATADDLRSDNLHPTLDEAIKMVKAAGYVVGRQKKLRKARPKKKRVGPTFVAEFSDGVITRMSTFVSSLENLDWERGTALAIAAYQSRWRARARRERRLPLTTLWGPIPPPIVSAHFEQDGKVLETRP